MRLLPELAENGLVGAPRSALTPDQERRLMFAAVGRFLENIAGVGGALLLLDDLQWAGADALDLLAALVRSSGETGVRVIGAYRDTEVRPADPLAALLADLAREGMATQHELERLGTPEAQELLRSLLRDMAAGEDAVAADSQDAEQPPTDQGVSPVVEQVLRRAGGVPFFVVSYAQTIRLEGPEGLDALDLTPGAPRSTSPPERGWGERGRHVITARAG